MRISVIIPTYKPQAYLWECLDSMVAQTFPKEEFEVILVLNGCTEPYMSDIEQYIDLKMGSMNVQFIHTEQRGVSNARNIGLDAAKGEYIAFIDDDDYVSPAYLKELYKAASPDTISLCYPYAFNDGKPEIQLAYEKSKVFDKYCNRRSLQLASKVRKFFSGPCMKLIPMSSIQKRRFDVRFRNGEDAIFMFLISDRVTNVVFANRKAIYYRRFRQHSAFLSQKSLGYRVYNNLRMIGAFSYIFVKKPLVYNCAFFMTRILAALKSIV